MPYDPKSLARLYQVPVAAGDMCSRYMYATNDAAATVEAANYFTDKRLKKGDMIEVVAARSGTPVTKTYVLTSVNASGQATAVLQATAAG